MRRSIASLLFVAGVACGAEKPILPQDYFFQQLPVLEHPVGVELLFGPRENIPARIIRAIDGAREEVLVNHFTITSGKILDALQRACQRHCIVIVLVDENANRRLDGAFTELRRRNIPNAAISCDAGRWNGNKYMVIDRASVVTGTADLTDAAGKNHETLMVFEEPSLVIRFYNHFVGTAFPARVPSP